MTTTTSIMQADTAQGFRLHRAGNLNEAARCYEAALARDPADPDASCLLGVVHQEQGRPERAVEYIRRALDIRPDVPAYHASLGLAWQALGRPAEAADAFSRVLVLIPNDAAAHVNRGVSVRALGDRDGALSHFRRAAELDPLMAQARTNLGGLLLELGRPQEALPHCQTAAALQPWMVEVHLNLGEALLALGQPAEAAAAFSQAFRLDPKRARAAAGIGLASVRLGAWNEGLDWLRQAVALEPGSVEFLRYLAETAGMLSLYPEVKACCERILALDPDQAVAHNALAWILQDSGRHDEALEHYRAAVRLQPDFATAHFNFGVFHEELGDLAEAEARYRSTMQCDPTHATALARLATLLREALPEADIEKLRRLLSSAETTGPDRANLLFGLALVHDGLGDYPDAAASLEEANALALDELARQGRAYEPYEHRRFIDALISTFTPDLFERLVGAGPDTTRPVFIIGLPRSGTTLIEQVLASHPEVHGAGEVTLARRSFEELPELVGGSGNPLDAASRLDRPTLQELARRHERRLAELDGGRARRVIGKMPDNYFYLGLIALMFPRAVVIHCRREPRDVALSCWFTNFRDVQWANHHDHIASRFHAHRRLMEHWKAALPSTFTIHEVAYEEAVVDLEGQARRLLSAMDLDWDPACLDFHRVRRPVRTASQVQVRKPVHRGSVGRWRLYRDELAGLFAKVQISGQPHPETPG